MSEVLRYNVVKGPGKVVISFGDREVLEVLVGKVITPKFTGKTENGLTIFDILNKYIKTIDHSQQEMLYNVLYGYLKNGREIRTERLVEQAKGAFRDIMAIPAFGYEAMDRFTQGLIVPTKLKETFGEETNEGHREDLTYLIQEYRDLIGLIIIVKAMIPVMEVVKRKLMTLNRSEMVNDEVVGMMPDSVVRHPGFIRLERLISGYSEGKEIPEVVMLEMKITSSDYEKYIMNNTFVCRLSFAIPEDIPLDGMNVITYIIVYIKGKVDNKKVSKYKNKVKPKDSEKETSMLEAYWVKGDYTIAQVAMFETNTTKKYISRMISGSDNRVAVQIAKDLYNYPVYITPVMLYLCAAIMSDMVAPITRTYATRDDILYQFGVCYARLRNELPDVAMLFASTPVFDDEGEMIRGNAGVLKKLSNDVSDRILNEYDILDPVSNRNICLKVIDNMTRQLAFYTRVPIVRDALILPDMIDRESGLVILPESIRDQIGKVILTYLCD